MTYAGVEYWDGYYRARHEAGDDLDWGGRWTAPFLGPLRDSAARTVLELGCGTGNDAARLAGEGYTVTAVDLSGEAIAAARTRHGGVAGFFSDDCLRELPRGRCRLALELVEVAHRRTGLPFRWVWRGLAHRYGYLGGSGHRLNVALDTT